MTTNPTDHNELISGGRAVASRDSDHRLGRETKPSFKTTELIVYVLSVLGVLIASLVIDIKVQCLPRLVSSDLADYRLLDQPRLGEVRQPRRLSLAASCRVSRLITRSQARGAPISQLVRYDQCARHGDL
jgi:hypothetical protein